MKIVPVIILAGLSLVIQSCASLFPMRPDPSRELGARIDSVLDDSVLAPSFVGLKVVSLSDGRVLYARHANKLFHPASNMKVLTTATAVGMLDRNYTFTTDILADSNPENGLLAGNLYIAGSGDPMITSLEIASVADTIARLGVRYITGNLVGDVSRFDDVVWGSGWMWDDEPEAYEAFITPLTVNENAIHLTVAAGLRAGDSVRYTIDPPTKFVSVINAGKTTTDTLVPQLTVTRVRNTNTIDIKGGVKPSERVQEFDLSVWKPEMYFLELLREGLTTCGIVVAGSATLDTARGRVQITRTSHPIDSVLAHINKPSDNLAAEILLKTIAAEKRGRPGSAEAGLGVVRQYLASLGVDTTMLTLADGSGLSSYDLVSPDILVRILQRQYDDKLNFQRFYESLPIAGVDGTLRNRMKHGREAGNVHAKTGTISGVSTLSGYVTASDGRMLAFSIMANHFPGGGAPLRRAQDKIMELLANFSDRRP